MGKRLRIEFICGFLGTVVGWYSVKISGNVRDALLFGILVEARDRKKRFHVIRMSSAFMPGKVPGVQGFGWGERGCSINPALLPILGQAGRGE